MAGKLAHIPGELPTLNDWENHLTTIFPEVRTGEIHVPQFISGLNCLF